MPYSKLPTDKIALLSTVIVYLDNAIVGQGWTIWYPSGRGGNCNLHPTLIGLDGKELEPAWYQLKVVDNYWVPVTKEIH